MSDVKQLTAEELQQELASKMVIDTIKKIKEVPFEGGDFVQDKAMKFCKQQELQKRTSPKGVKEFEKRAGKALDKKYPGLYKKTK